MGSHLIFSIAQECTQITLKLFNVQVLLVDVQRKLTVAMYNFPTFGTYPLAVVEIFILRQVDVLDVSSDVKFRVCRIVAFVAMIISNFSVHSSNVKWNFPLFGELFLANGTFFTSKMECGLDKQ